MRLFREYNIPACTLLIEVEVAEVEAEVAEVEVTQLKVAENLSLD